MRGLTGFRAKEPGWVKCVLREDSTAEAVGEDVWLISQIKCICGCVTAGVRSCVCVSDWEEVGVCFCGLVSSRDVEHSGPQYCSARLAQEENEKQQKGLFKRPRLSPKICYVRYNRALLFFGQKSCDKLNLHLAPLFQISSVIKCFNSRFFFLPVFGFTVQQPFTGNWQWCFSSFGYITAKNEQLLD